MWQQSNETLNFVIAISGYRLTYLGNTYYKFYFSNVFFPVQQYNARSSINNNFTYKASLLVAVGCGFPLPVALPEVGMVPPVSV